MKIKLLPQTFLLSLFFVLISAAAMSQGNSDVRDLIARLQFVNPQALEAFVNDMRSHKGFNTTTAVANLQYIKQNLAVATERLTASQTSENIKAAQLLLDKQRALTMANPLLDMDKIAVTRFVLDDQARTSTTNKMCMPMSNYMGLIDVPTSGYNAQISLLSSLRSTTPAESVIFKPTRGEGLADLQMHWNADRMMFAMPKPVVIDPFYNQEYPSWHIFEIGVDGKNLKHISQLPEPDLEFADPCYLPDGRVLFTTNVGYNGIPCEHGERVIMNLAIYDPQEKMMRKLTFDQDGNWSPTVLSDGRVMYTRWEYTDLTHYFTRIVMRSNPDGTECRALYGSGSFWPTSIYDMQQLPGTSGRFVGIVSGHHGIPRSGQLIIFDPAKGRKEADGVIQEIPFSKRKVVPVIKDRLVDGVWPQFSRPFPLNDKYFLVSAKLHPDGLWGVYLVDIFDNVTLITESEGAGYLTAVPVMKRPVPPVIPDRIVEGDKQATIYIQDIYTGEGLRGVPCGTVKKLRLFAYEYVYLKSPSDFDALGVQSGWDLKRELGEVPLEEDGSAIFKVPANTPISIQPLDENGNAIQWMRSWFTAMPGEVVSCVGCHEDQNTIALPRKVIASGKQPVAITPPKGGIRPFSFELEVQPVLDKYCISCHTGEKAMDLTDRSKREYVRWGNYKTHRFMNESYYNLHPYVYRQGPEADLYVLRPYEYHASNSELMQMLRQGHYNVALEGEDLKTLCKWIDFNAPYFGDFEIAGRYKATFEQYPRRIELMTKYGNVSVDWKKELADYTKYLAAQPKINVIPSPLASAASVDRSWAFAPDQARAMQNKVAETQRTVKVAPGISMQFQWIPTGKYHNGTIKRGFWMGRLEVTNEQYCALVPTHDSRYIGEQWKDHTVAGLAANTPAQPVVRVSWQEAVDYCNVLSKKTGLKIALPTAEQWEWACRAGSADDMWYGKAMTDYSKFENLADVTIKKLAVWGLEPTVPMPANLPARKFWDYVPRDSFANDGALISVAGGGYEGNAWGLCDMHGNVAEWTLNGSEREKVVCGGSWRDRAAKATASTRRTFLAWQAPFNVGFRVIIEQE